MISKKDNPWYGFDFLPRELDHWFDNRLLTGIRSNQSKYPAVNLETSKDSYQYYVFVPGADKEKLSITVDKNLLTICGETPTLIPEIEGVSVYRRERKTGKFTRALNLPSDVNIEQITASYTNGVLDIIVQRQKMPEPAIIRVE